MKPLPPLPRPARADLLVFVWLLALGWGCAGAAWARDAAGETPAAVFDVAEDSPRLMVAALWENETAEPVRLRVTAPDGRVIGDGEFLRERPAGGELAAGSVIEEPELSGPRLRVLTIHRPVAGKWSLALAEPRPDLGRVKIQSRWMPTDGAPARIAWASPMMSFRGEDRMQLSWRVEGATERTVSVIRYSTRIGTTRGVPIETVRREGDRFTCEWDVRGVPAGDYYLMVSAEEAGSTHVEWSQAPAIVTLRGRARLDWQAEAAPARADSAPQVVFRAQLVPAMALPGQVFLVRAEIANTGEADSAPVELALRVPPEVRTEEAAPPVTREADGERIVRLETVPAKGTVFVRFRLTAPPALDAVPIELRLAGEQAELAERALTPWRGQVRIAATPEALRADLQVERAVLRGVRRVGEEASYVVTVRNAGPAKATAVKLREWLNNARYLDVSPAQGSGKVDLAEGNRAEVWLGDIEAGASVRTELRVRLESAGKLIGTSVATAAETDPAPADNERIVDDVFVEAGFDGAGAASTP